MDEHGDIAARLDGERVDTGTERMIAVIDGAIGWLIFNNPARRNAVSIDMWAAIPRALSRFETDARVRVVIAAGAGDKAFVSGADISQFEDKRANPEDNEEYKRISGEGSAGLSRLTKPSIAMIQGYCIGGGLAVALSCDIRIAAHGSRFAIPAAKLALGYNYSGIANLVALVGPAYTREIMFTARQFEAEEALRIGLINRLVPRDELEHTTRSYAAMIAANAPLTIHAAKMAVHEALTDPGQRDVARVEAAVDACFSSDDYKEGRAAFMQKRTPRFLGK